MRAKSTIVGVVLASWVFAEAAAQPNQEAGGVTIEEVVVTAQKKEQSLLEVPIAVSVVSNGEIADRGAMNIKDLQYSIPSLYITNNGPGQDRIQMRGGFPRVHKGCRRSASISMKWVSRSTRYSAISLCHSSTSSESRCYEALRVPFTARVQWVARSSMLRAIPIWKLRDSKVRPGS